MSPDGWYMFMLFYSANKTGDRARLISDTQILPSTIGCFQFWYRLSTSSNTNRLNVYKSRSGPIMGTAIWTKSGHQGNQWRLGKVDVTSSVFTGYMAFEGVVGNRGEGYIAIDDISFTGGSFCKTIDQISCDFEESTCGYKNETIVGTGYAWTRNNLNSTNANITDHTTETELGYFMYTKQINSSSANVITRLRSPVSNETGSKCLVFFYNMFDSPSNKLTVLVTDNSSAISSVWSSNSNQGNKWIKAFADIKTLSSYQVVFEAEVGKHIAIDDVLLKDEVCPHFADCNFEDDDFCRWELVSDPSVSLDWIVSDGDDIWEIGPAIDHTLGTTIGKFLYFENDYMKPDRARIQSPVFEKSSSAVCFQFWYYISGNQATLNIVQKFPSNSKEFLIWTLGGDQGKQWLRATIPIYTLEDLNIILEAVSGASFGWSSVSIDDIEVSDNQCMLTPLNAKPNPLQTFTATVLTSTRTPAVKINTTSDSFNCDFEDFGLCGWKSDSSKKIQWERSQGIKAASAWQPIFDYSKQTADGFYLHVDSGLPKQAGDSAMIISPTVPKSNMSVHCLEFAYFMYGDDVGTLNLYVTPGAVSPTSPVFKLTGSRGKDWFLQKLTFFFNSNFDLTLWLEAVVGSGVRGSIAIDDIKMSDGSCTKNTCDFESNDICGYVNDLNTDFNWTRNSGPTASYQTG